MRDKPIKSLLVRGALLLCLTLSIGGLAGCSWFGSLFGGQAKKELERTPESLAMEGMDAYQRQKYEAAVESFQKLKDRFPYHQYAILAELKLADSHFLNKDYDLAALNYKEFEKLHPTNEVIPYVIFQTGLSYFKQMPTVDRDQSKTRLALQEFERLIKGFPNSEYIPQAKANIAAVKKNLVLHEFLVGEYYYKEKNCRAALGRFEGILKNYPDIPPPPKLNGYLESCRQKLVSSK